MNMGYRRTDEVKIIRRTHCVEIPSPGGRIITADSVTDWFCDVPKGAVLADVSIVRDDCGDIDSVKFFFMEENQQP